MNIHKVLANAVVLSGFAAVPFIPFVILSSTTFFPFIVGKNFAFRVVVEIMFAAWMVLAVVDPVYRPKKSWIIGSFAAFLGIITLAAIFGENPEKSFWSNFERMEGVVTYLHLFVYIIVASTVLSVRDLWRPYLNLHLAAGVIMAIYGVLQWAGVLAIVQDGARVNGTLGNAAYMGTYALFNIFIAGFFLVREGFTQAGERARVVIYGAIALLQAFVLYHTATRGAMLGLIAGVLLTALVIALFEKGRPYLRLSAVGMLFAVVLGVGVFLGARDTEFVRKSPVLGRFASISLQEQTTKSRFMVWNMAWQGFKERPVLGWGMESFNYVFNKYYDPNMYDQEQWFDRAHNVFFDWLVAGGILGLLGYLSLFGCAVYCLWWRARGFSVSEKAVLTGLLGGYFFQNLFVFDNLTSLIYFGTILAFIESATIEPSSGKQKNKHSDNVSEDLAVATGWAAVVLGIALVYLVNHNGYSQNTTLIRAMTQRYAGGPSENLALFKEALGYGSFGTAEAREQLAQFSFNAFGTSGMVSLDQKGFIDLAIEEFDKQIKSTPNDARYRLFAGSYLLRLGKVDEALPHLEKARELSPKKQTILFELGSAYYAKRDIKKTEELLKEAYEFAPEYDRARNFYAEVLRMNGKAAIAARVLAGE